MTLQQARVELIASATRTCQAYAQSLQSAIDRAGLPAATGKG